MAILKMNLLSVMKGFPAYKTTIKRLYRKDETFQSICADYETCCEALERWNQSHAEQAPFRRKEYEDLLRDLKFEILQYLAEHSQK